MIRNMTFLGYNASLASRSYDDFLRLRCISFRSPDHTHPYDINIIFLSYFVQRFLRKTLSRRVNLMTSADLIKYLTSKWNGGTNFCFQAL